MCTQQETLEQKKQENITTMQEQQAHAPVYQEDVMAMYMQTRGGQYAKDLREAYLEQTAHMQDTAKLGKKSFKSNTAEKKLRNEKIDKSKLLTERATAYTLEVYDQMKEVCGERQREARKEARRQTTDQKVEILKTMGNWQQDTTEQQAAFLTRLWSVRDHIYSPDMFLSSSIRQKENFMKYYTMIEEYDELMEEYQKDPQAYADYAADVTDLAEHLGPVLAALLHRLEVYCEQNRVSLDGEILDETAESATLEETDITDWFERVREYNEWKLHFNSYGGPLSDEERLRFRQMREEAGRPEVQQNIQNGHTLSRTRQEAISTPSDQLEQMSRQQLRGLNRRLYEAGFTDLAKLIQSYVVGTRYAVGYTEERQRLKKAIAAVDAALKTYVNNDAPAELRAVKNYFRSMTNGSLQIPEGSPIIDCTTEKLKETGADGAGSTRNAILRQGMRWSNQKDTPLFSHSPVVNDLKQRLVSNCYMVASVSGLVNQNPELIKQCIRDNGDGTVTVRLFEYFRVEKEADGIKNPVGDDIPEDDLNDTDIIEVEEIPAYELRPVYVKVTKEIPRIGGADALSAGALWMQMIEKACAYVGRNDRTGYQSLWYGEGGEFLRRLLGIEPQVDYRKEAYQGAAAENEAFQAMKNELFENIRTARTRNVVYNAGTSNESMEGLNSGHAYAVLGAKEENGKKYVLLRNPYSTHSMQYDKNGKKTTSGWALSTGSDETYGQFYMEFDEFINSFDKVTHTDLNTVTTN